MGRPSGTMRAGIVAIVALAAVFIAQEKLFYRDRRPTRAGVRLNRWWARAYGTGVLPSWLVSLETVGRRSGKRRVHALVRADYEGQPYLVSMLGDTAEWIRNARAHGGRATIHHGRRTAVRLEEAPAGERAAIIKAYLSRARGARRHVAVRHDAPLEMFRAVAGEYPVFRIVPDVSSAAPMPRAREVSASGERASERAGYA